MKFIKAPDPGAANQNLSPAAGYQFFGHVAIKADTGVMTVTLRDTADTALMVDRSGAEAGVIAFGHHAVRPLRPRPSGRVAALAG